MLTPFYEYYYFHREIKKKPLPVGFECKTLAYGRILFTTFQTHINGNSIFSTRINIIVTRCSYETRSSMDDAQTIVV